MRAAFLVAWREYAENAKTKGFWIGIFLLPVILFLSGYIPILLEKKGRPTRHFVLVDQSAQFETVILDALNAASAPPPAARPADAEVHKPRFLRAPLPRDLSPAGDLAELSQQLKPYLRGDRKIDTLGQPENLYAAILIPAALEQYPPSSNPPNPDLPAIPPQTGPNTNAVIQYWSANLTDKDLLDVVERAVNGEVRRREYLRHGLDARLIKQVEAARAPFASLNPKKDAGQEKVNRADVQRQWMTVGFVYLLWVAIFSISQMLLNNVIEEKSNRIIEVLLSSVTPSELMMGKLAGIAAVGLTMVGAWMLSLVVILGSMSGGSSPIGKELLAGITGSNLLPAFVVYFFFGYLIYAALILALGSVCNTLKEAQNYMGMLTMIMIVPLLTMMFIAKDPNGTIARVLSWIPPYTPFLMMNRAAADPPAVDLVGTMILLIVSTLGALWLAGKVFRIGILRTGQPPKLVEMIRWLKRG